MTRGRDTTDYEALSEEKLALIEKTERAKQAEQKVVDHKIDEATKHTGKKVKAGLVLGGPGAMLLILAMSNPICMGIGIFLVAAGGISVLAAGYDGAEAANIKNNQRQYNNKIDDQTKQSIKDGRDNPIEDRDPTSLGNTIAARKEANEAAKEAAKEAKEAKRESDRVASKVKERASDLAEMNNPYAQGVAVFADSAVKMLAKQNPGKFLGAKEQQAKAEMIAALTFQGIDPDHFDKAVLFTAIEQQYANGREGSISLATTRAVVGTEFEGKISVEGSAIAFQGTKEALDKAMKSDGIVSREKGMQERIPDLAFKFGITPMADPSPAVVAAAGAGAGAGGTGVTPPPVATKRGTLAPSTQGDLQIARLERMDRNATVTGVAFVRPMATPATLGIVGVTPPGGGATGFTPPASASAAR